MHSEDIPSGLVWRKFGWFFVTMVLTGFVLNEVWEMAQMSAYTETAVNSWPNTLGLCTRAAVGDVAIILGIYAAGALAAGDLFWGLRGRWNIYATAALLGLAYAVLVEHAALVSVRKVRKGVWLAIMHLDILGNSEA